jgi:hypothetical protein
MTTHENLSRTLINASGRNMVQKRKAVKVTTVTPRKQQAINKDKKEESISP